MINVHVLRKFSANNSQVKIVHDLPPKIGKAIAKKNASKIRFKHARFFSASKQKHRIKNSETHRDDSKIFST